MRHYNAHHNEDGFTLLELIIVMIFIGILSAISAPSFLTINQKNQVNSDLASAKSALLEAQRGAMRTGKNCTLSFDYVTSPDIARRISSSSGNCLSTGERKLYNVSMQVSTDNTNLVSITGSGAASLTFDYLGNLGGTTPITIVLQHKSDTGDQKCIVVSSPLGLIATGKYAGTNANISSRCTP